MAIISSARRPSFSFWPIAMVLNAVLLAFCVFAVTQAVKHRESEVIKLNHQILA